MKAYLLEWVRGADSGLTARNMVREYLQARILESLQRAGAMVPLAFHGGTALRFLFATARYFEDLDFALERDAEAFDFSSCLQAIRRDFQAEAYAVEIKFNAKKVVCHAFVRFPGLLHELGLSPHAGEALSVKLEVDTRPPAGAGLAVTLIRRHVTLRIQHHDRASLLAGKLHAVLQRPYTKGRDWYDLFWYLSDPDWPAPNLVLLNNALRQSGWSLGDLDGNTWRAAVRQRVQDMDWRAVVSDLRPFLAAGVPPELLTRENLLSLL